MNIIPDGDLPEPEFYYLYVYNSDGYHNGKIKILPSDLDNMFLSVISLAKQNKGKVILTDEWDNCMFHMENGEVLFPKPQHMSNEDLDNFLN